jgi:SAM-dependent methyltransferase
MTDEPTRHWDAAYSTKRDAELSWTQPEPRLSLELIAEACPPSASRRGVIDAGGGASPLAGRLLDAGYPAVTVLDLSPAALASAAARLGDRAARVRWITADVTAAPPTLGDLGTFDVWHDRAVFHFLTTPAQRTAYVALLSRTVPVGGHAVIATFALDGPEKCSGLPVTRYDGPALAVELGGAFRLFRTVPETHLTPWGKPQSFQYSVFRRVSLE